MKNNEYKITQEIADAYRDLMQVDLSGVDFYDDPFDAKRRGVTDLMATLRGEYSHLERVGAVMDYKEVQNALGGITAAWLMMPDCSKVDSAAYELKEALASLKSESPPKERLNKRLDATRELLDGDKGVIFAVTPQGVTRWGLSADCRINRNAHHIGAVIIALATSLGFIEEEGDDD